MQFDPVIQDVQMHVGSSNSDEKTTANERAASMRVCRLGKLILATKMETKSKDKIC